MSPTPRLPAAPKHLTRAFKGVLEVNPERLRAAGAGTATVYGYDPAQVWVVRRRDFRLIRDPFTKAEQGLTRFVLEGRFGVAFPQPSAINLFTVLTP